MKMWFIGGTGSSGAARGRNPGIAGRLDAFVAEIAQAVEDRAPANYAVDANYRPIGNGAGASVYSRAGADREGSAQSSRKRRLMRDPRRAQ